MKRIGLLIIAALCLSGCASMVSGTNQNIEIDSEPSGATVTVGIEKRDYSYENNTTTYTKKISTSRIAGVTPITVSIPRKDGIVQISKEGYKTQLIEMKRGLNPWFLGNIVLTSLLSSSIDTSTGAISEYKPGQYMITLEPENAPEKTPSDSPTL
jgi:uncharacterized protein YceK